MVCILYQEHIQWVLILYFNMKAMKYKYLSILIFSLLLGCSESFLDLSPHSQLSETNYFKTSEDFKSALNGVYGILKEGPLYGTQWYVISEIPSDNTREQLSGSVTDQDEFDEFYLRSTNPYLANFWNSSYKGIMAANTVINKIDNVVSDVNVRDQYKLEAKFLRSLMYFNLLRVFGDVPLVVDNVSISESYNILREPKETVYNFIIEELTDAESLPDKYTNNNDIGRATSGAAKALIARIYMTIHEYEKAEAKLKEIIDSNIYELLENEVGSLNINGYAAFFDPDNHNNQESIFEVQSKKGGFGLGSGLPNAYAPIGSGNLVVPVGNPGANNIPVMDIYNEYEEGDLRRDFSMRLGYYNNDGVWVENPYVNKFMDVPYQNGDANNNFPVFRYADILLLYAEVLNINNKPAEALEYLNKVRRRGFGYQSNESTPIDITTTDKNQLSLIIERERRVELAFEGKRWFDLVRTGRAVEVLTQKGFKLNETNTVFPIPQAQIDINPKLTQNNYVIESK